MHWNQWRVADQKKELLRGIAALSEEEYRGAKSLMNAHDCNKGILWSCDKVDVWETFFSNTPFYIYRPRFLFASRSPPLK
jgi:hypothetical protein